MKGIFPTDKFSQLATPFYYYDADLLRRTLHEITSILSAHPAFVMHYAIKANTNPKVLRIISQAGFGADCVSGGEIKAALDAGFPAHGIVFAGVGKGDWEINLALDRDIFCFNVESLPELEVINSLAKAKGKVARVCLRINPNVGAHTHAKITTGLAENKFGIALSDMETVIAETQRLDNVKFIGLHFHIGSQMLDMGDFESLCNRINDIQKRLEQIHVSVDNINVGGGLGVSYANPNEEPIADYQAYFGTYAHHLHLRPGQHLHFELGRAIVAQMGSLIGRVLYVKQGTHKQFCILDAGMTDLIRPALYQAYHKIENVSSDELMQTYDVVGPVCESSDVFGKAVDLNACHRGDFVAIRSAGAYGETMASQYNCRQLPVGYISDELR